MRLAFIILLTSFLFSCSDTKISKRIIVPLQEITYLKLKGDIQAVSLANLRNVDVLRGGSIVSVVDTVSTRKYVFDRNGNLVCQVFRTRQKQNRDSLHYYSDSFFVISDSFFFDSNNYPVRHVSYSDGIRSATECSFDAGRKELVCNYYDPKGKLEESSVETYDEKGNPKECRYYNEKAGRYLWQTTRHVNRSGVEVKEYNKNGTLKAWSRSTTDTTNGKVCTIEEDSSGLNGYNRLKTISVLGRSGNIVERSQFDKADSISSHSKWFYDNRGNDTFETSEFGGWFTRKFITNHYDGSGRLAVRSYFVTYPLRNNERGDAVSEWYLDHDAMGNYRKSMTVISRSSGSDTSWQIREFQYFR